MTDAVERGCSPTADTSAHANLRRTAHIEAAEIVPGLVVRLDPRVLGADPEVCNTQDPPVTRAGLFVCVAMQGDATAWAGLTTQHRPERMLILPEWRSGGFRRWRLTSQYLTDGAALWFGPRDAFVAASAEEVLTRSRNRARVSLDGLAAIRQEIAAQGHRRHRSCASFDSLAPSAGKERRPPENGRRRR